MRVQELVNCRVSKHALFNFEEMVEKTDLYINTQGGKRSNEELN